MRQLSTALAILVVGCLTAAFTASAGAATSSFCVGGTTVGITDPATVGLFNTEIANGGIVDVLTATTGPNGIYKTMAGPNNTTVMAVPQELNPTYESETSFSDGPLYWVDSNGQTNSYTYTDESVSAGACGSGTHAAVSTAAAPRTPDSVFLCYSTFQSQPGVWQVPEAQTLAAQGYWAPFALSGDVAGGTNIGGYHLACNVKTAQGLPTTYLDDGGATHGSAYANTFGVYPVVG